MEKSAIKKIGEIDCTDCFSCYNKCPIENAIEMKINTEGFYRPFITSKCINCGICADVCPVLETPKNNNKVEEIYAGWSKNEEILLRSSSGGIFSEISEKVIENKGIVYAVGWDEKNNSIFHKRIENKEQLKEVTGSKYIPSYVGKIYDDIKRDLSEEKEVIFVGTPCQVAGLNKIIKDEKLLTIDFICHGMPSYKAYKKYCDETYNGKVTRTEFRDKKYGWEKYSLKILENNKVLEHKNFGKNNFIRGFLKDIYLDTACYECKFRANERGENRQADITLADFWGAPEEIKNYNGVSLIIINNEKGKKYFEKIKEGIFFKKVGLQEILKNNISFYKNPTFPKERKEFFKLLEKETFEKLAVKYFKKQSRWEKLKNSILKRVKVK